MTTELDLLRRVAEAARLVHKAWREDRSYVNKMCGLGMALKALDAAPAPLTGAELAERHGFKPHGRDPLTGGPHMSVAESEGPFSEQSQEAAWQGALQLLRDRGFDVGALLEQAAKNAEDAAPAGPAVELGQVWQHSSPIQPGWQQPLTVGAIEGDRVVWAGNNGSTPMRALSGDTWRRVVSEEPKPKPHAAANPVCATCGLTYFAHEDHVEMLRIRRQPVVGSRRTRLDTLKSLAALGLLADRGMMTLVIEEDFGDDREVVRHAFEITRAGLDWLEKRCDAMDEALLVAAEKPGARAEEGGGE